MAEPTATECACHAGQVEHYTAQAQQLLTDLSHYEAVHPKDAPCLLDVLGTMRERLNG